MDRRHEVINNLMQNLGPLPQPDRTAPRWNLYDYNKLNKYYGVNLPDSLWRGLIQLTPSYPGKVVTGVYYCAFPKDLSQEEIFYQILENLYEFSKQTQELTNLYFVAPEKAEVPIVQQVERKVSWWRKFLTFLGLANEHE